MRILGLFALNFRLALRYLLVLLLACAVLLGLVLLSLPKALFSKGDVPAVSIAFVYGDGTRSDTMMRNLSAEVDGIDVLDEFYVCTAEEAEELLAAGQVDAIIEMPEDTLDALVYGGHATVTVKASDPFMGAVVFSVVERAVDALDEIQNYALIYAGVAAEHFADEEQLWRAVNDFDFQLVSVAAGRLAAVDLQSEVSPYYAQLLTMLSFAVGAVAALFVSVVCARQYAQGHIRRLRYRQVRFGQLLLVQMLLGALLSALLGLMVACALRFLAPGLNIGAALLSSALLGLVLTPIFLVFSGLPGPPAGAATRAMLGCLALCFLMLFVGGGFYPSFLMESSLRLGNPAWLANLLAIWSLGGNLEPMQLLGFVVPVALAAGICYFEWRKVS